MTYFMGVPRCVTKCDRGRGVKIGQKSVTYFMDGPKMSIPSEDIGLLSGKAAIVRVKLSVDSGEIKAARSAFP